MKLESLTKEQEELMISTRDEWVNKFFNLKEIDKKEFEKGIDWLYSDLLKKPNPKVIYCDSWIGALITISILKNNRASVGASVRASVLDSVGASVRASVLASVGASVRDSVGASVRASVGASVWDSVRASVGASVWASVRASVRAEFSNHSNYLDTGTNFGWVSFYDYFEKIGILNNDNFKKYKKLLSSGAFQVYEYENFVFAIQPPKTISRNENGQLHNVGGKAFEFNDGYGFYYINGREMPSRIFEEIITFESFLKEENEDVKAGIITVIKERNGNDGLLKFLNAVVIDEKTVNHFDGYTEIIRLYKTNEKYSFLQDRFGNMNQPYCWSEITCPSTGSVYLIDNSADFTCAVKALEFLRPSFVPEGLEYKWEHSAN